MLKEPIVEGAYYELASGSVFGPVAVELSNEDSQYIYVSDCSRSRCINVSDFTRRVWITHTDPAEVVAELRRGAHDVSPPSHPAPRGSFADGCAIGWGAAADLVAEKLGVKS